MGFKGLWNVVNRDTFFPRDVRGGCEFWWPGGWPRPELTWCLVKCAQEKGLATEASISAINFAYQKLDWHSVETHLDDNNEAALKLVLRLGGSKLTRETFPDEIDRNVYSMPHTSGE